MNIQHLRDYFLRKIQIVFGLIDFECKPHTCGIKGYHHQIHFSHPKNDNIKISIYLYNKNEIRIVAPENEMLFSGSQSIFIAEKALEELSKIA